MPDPQAETRRATQLGLRPARKSSTGLRIALTGRCCRPLASARLLSPQLKETAAAATAEGDEPLIWLWPIDHFCYSADAATVHQVRTTSRFANSFAF
jgi:hypothetical protein